MLARVKSASDACMLSVAPDAKEIFDATINGNQIVRNTWLAIITGGVTSKLDFATSQVLGPIVEKALNGILANGNYPIVRFQNWNSFKNVITADLMMCR
jgi:hypothetical protein